MVQEYVRTHPKCPFCGNRLRVVIRELGERVLGEEYIRHFFCPNCSERVELVMKEYLGSESQFQRAIYARKITVDEDIGDKLLARGVSIFKI